MLRDGTGKAANFYASDPAAAINCGTDPSTKPTANGYSFATWMKLDSLGSRQLVDGDWNDGGTSGQKYFYHFAMLDDYLTLYLGEPGSDAISLYASSYDPLVTDTWTHVGFTVTPSAFSR